MQLQKVMVPSVKLMLQSYCQFGISIKMLLQEALVHSILHKYQGPKKGLTDARSAVGFCLGSGLFGSYNSD